MTVDLEQPGAQRGAAAACARRPTSSSRTSRPAAPRAVRADLPRAARRRRRASSSRCSPATAARAPTPTGPASTARAFFARSGIDGLIGDRRDAAGAVAAAARAITSPALNLLAAMLAALRLRDRNGDGPVRRRHAAAHRRVDGRRRHPAGAEPRRVGRRAPGPRTHGLLTRNAYQTADGRWLLLTMPLPSATGRGCAQALGLPEWADGFAATRRPPRCARTARRCSPRSTRCFREHDPAYWTRALDEAGCIWAPVAMPPEVVRDPQLRTPGAFERMTSPAAARTRCWPPPSTFAAPTSTRAAPRRRRRAHLEVLAE